MASSTHVLPDPFPRRVGEQLLNHLFYREETAFVIEGSSLRSAKATREAYACARLGSCLHLTILRHPVDRVISRYWFEAVHNQTVAARPPHSLTDFCTGSRVVGVCSRNP